MKAYSRLAGSAALALLIGAAPNALSNEQDKAPVILDNDHLGLTLEPTPYEYGSILCTSQNRPAVDAITDLVCQSHMQVMQYAGTESLPMEQALANEATRSQAHLIMNKLRTLLDTVRPYGGVSLASLISPTIMARDPDNQILLTEEDTLETTIFSVMDEELDFMEMDLSEPTEFMNEAYRYSTFMSYVFQCNPAFGRTDVKAAFTDVTHTFAEMGRLMPTIDTGICAGSEAKFETVAAVIK
ncbi:MAG TPA: hypothetical protein VIN59_01175 [Alphaproteobacteria bacterium]